MSGHDDESNAPTLLELQELWDECENSKHSLQEYCQKLYIYAMALEAHGKTWNATQRLKESAYGSNMIKPDGCPDAMYEMGIRYSSGFGITCDDEGDCANYWFTRAAEKGHVGAIEKLKICAAKKASASQP
jgi:TPR repeat protein